jgi:putative hydrolase of the HAD superfamily
MMIFFDVVGTLIEPRGSVGEIYARFGRSFGFDPSAAELQHAFAREFRRQPPLAFPPEITETVRRDRERGWWRALVKAVLGPAHRDPRFDQYFAAVFEFFGRAEAWQIYDDVRSTLAELGRRQYRLGIISNFDSRLIPLLDDLGLTRHFDSIHISSREGAAKPDPAIFRAALARDRLTSAWHIGDSLAEDIAGAEAAGLRAVWVDRAGCGTDPARRPRVTNLDQLLDLFPGPDGPALSR